jgi:apolipoprotein N-acyltransferase
VSNLAWYGESTAIPQHLQISRMRSLETGRPMLRATNTAPPPSSTPRRDPGTDSLLRPGRAGGHGAGHDRHTPYIRFGNLGFLGLGALALLGAWLAGRKRRGA